MKTLLLLVLVPSLAFGANTWYVDFGSGVDSNAGNSTSVPWKHIPGDSAATGVAASTTVNTGDTVYLKGGVVYAAANSNNIVVKPPTYSAAGFSILSGDIAGWGSGKAVIDGNGFGAFVMIVVGVSNMSLGGFEGRNTLANGQDAGLALHTTTNCFLYSLLIHDIGTNNIGGQGPHCDGIGTDGQGANPCGGNIISNCTIHDVTQKGYETGAGCTNNIIKNCVIYNCSDHGITFSSQGNVAFGNVISNCSAVVWSETVQDPAYGIKLSSASINDTHTNLVYNNIIAHCIGGVVVENIGTSNMYGNKLFNNTLIDIDSSDNTFRAAFRFRVSSTGTINGTQVKNNLFCSQAVNDTFSPCSMFTYCDNSLGVVGTNNLVDHNLFFSTVGTSTKCLIFQNTGPTVVVSWANFADSGSTSPDNRFKGASLGTGNTFDGPSQFFDTDPKFKTYPTDLHLLPNSPVASAGTNLSGFFTTDFYGTTRVNWSMGAVDHLPAPPTAAGATISIGAGVNLGNGVKSL